MERSSGKIDAIVDRQVRLWLEARKLNAGSRDDTSLMPCITLSRQYGSRGAELGQLLAQKSGFAFWDQAIVNALSKRAGVDEQMVATLDENTRTSMDVFIDTILRGRSYSEGEYLRQLMRFVHTLGKHGESIIVGRGAQYILDESSALHVRVISPFSKRVRQLAKRKDISERAAAAEIERVGKERIAFIERQYGRDISETSAYDLVVNLGTLSLEQALEIIAVAYEQRFGLRPAAATSQV